MYELVPKATEVRKDDVRVASADQKLAERARRCTHEFCASTTRERMSVSLSAGRRAQHHIRRRVVGIRVLHMWEERGIVGSLKTLNVNRLLSTHIHYYFSNHLYNYFSVMYKNRFPHYFRLFKLVKLTFLDKKSAC